MYNILTIPPSSPVNSDTLIDQAAADTREDSGALTNRDTKITINTRKNSESTEDELFDYRNKINNLPPGAISPTSTIISL